MVYTGSIRIGFLVGLLGCFSGCGAGTDALDNPVSSPTMNGERPAIRQGVMGRVTTSAGRPVAGAVVTPRFRGPGPAPAIPEIARTSDAEGRYVWPLPAGEYDLTVRAQGYTPSTQAVRIRSGEVVRLDFRLEEGPR